MTDTTHPLRGIRVLEFGGYISAPYATSFLTGLGADVVKIERATGDDFRRGMDAESPYFAQYNAGKKSIAVDLRDSEAADAVRHLVAGADVLVENMRPGKMDVLGFGHTACTDLNPNLVYVSVNGFGSAGPLRDRPAYDTIGQAFGGLYSLLSPADRPGLSGTILADLISGITTAMGVLAALLGRSRFAESPRVETSLLEAVSTLTIDGLTQSFELGHDPSLTSRHPQAQNFCLHAACGTTIAVHLSNSQTFWRRLCTAIDEPSLADDPRFIDYRQREARHTELTAKLQAVFGRHSADHWEDRLSAHDVPFGPVLGMSDFIAHPQVKDLGLVSVEERTGFPTVHPPWRFDGKRVTAPSTVPRIGEHSIEVLSEAVPPGHVDSMVARGAVTACTAP